MRWLKRIILFVLIIFIVPALAHAGLWMAQDRPSSWNNADWTSSGILPKKPKLDSAEIYVFAARTGGLKGAFATHSWIVTKQSGSKRYNRYDVVGWGNPVRKNLRAPDGKWYSNHPTIHRVIRGENARKLIPVLEKEIAKYRWNRPGDYTIWPGPNSNTFVSTIISRVPQLAAAVPSTAVGRDYPTDGQWISVQDGTFRATAGGYFGIVVGSKVGLELNFLGLVAGLNPFDLSIKVPAFGTYSAS